MSIFAIKKSVDGSTSNPNKEKTQNQNQQMWTWKIYCVFVTRFGLKMGFFFIPGAMKMYIYRKMQSNIHHSILWFLFPVFRHLNQPESISYRIDIGRKKKALSQRYEMKANYQMSINMNYKWILYTMIFVRIFCHNIFAALKFANSMWKTVAQLLCGFRNRKAISSIKLTTKRDKKWWNEEILKCHVLHYYLIRRKRINAN